MFSLCPGLLAWCPGAGTGALPLCTLLLNGPSFPPFPQCQLFQAVPWGNFDLERMRVTDLAASQGQAMSLSPGLGCLTVFRHWDTRR